MFVKILQVVISAVSSAAIFCFAWTAYSSYPLGPLLLGGIAPLAFFNLFWVGWLFEVIFKWAYVRPKDHYALVDISNNLDGAVFQIVEKTYHMNGKADLLKSPKWVETTLVRYINNDLSVILSEHELKCIKPSWPDSTFKPVDDDEINRALEIFDAYVQLQNDKKRKMLVLATENI